MRRTTGLLCLPLGTALALLLILSISLPLVAKNVTLVSPPPKEAEPGGFVTHVFKLENGSDSPAIYNIEAVSSNNWNIIGLLSTIELLPQKRAFIPLTVQVPLGVLAGTEDILSLTLRPRGDEGTTLTGSVATRVSLVPGVDIVPIAGKSGQRGEAVEYAVPIENRGNGRDTFEISVHSALGWKAEISPQQVAVAPQTSVEVYVRHFIPKSATAGATDPLTITVTSTTHPSASDHYTLRTTALGPAPPPPPDKNLFYVIPGSFRVGFPAADQTTRAFETALGLSGPISDKLRVALDLRGQAEPGRPNLAIDPRSLRLVGDTWGISWGKVPETPLNWLPRPEFTRGISVDYRAGQAHGWLSLGQRDAAQEDEPDRIAEASIELPLRGPGALNVAYSSLYSTSRPSRTIGLLGIEGNYSPRPDIEFDVGYGWTLATWNHGPLHITRMLAVQFGGKPLSAGINYRGTSPGPDAHGNNRYEVSIGADSGSYRIRANAGYEDEYGPPIPDLPHRVTASTALSLGLGQAINISYNTKAVRSKEPKNKTGDELYSSGVLRLSHRFERFTLTGIAIRKEISYPFAPEKSYQETDMELGWRGRLGATPIGLYVQRATRSFLTGGTSEELELGLDSEIYMMSGSVRLSPSIGLKESHDYGFPQHTFHIGLSGEAALGFADTLSFSCKLTQGLTGLPDSSRDLSTMECSLGIAHRFDILIPKARAALKAIVFEDRNGNGLIDKGEGESGLAGVRLSLDGTLKDTGPDGSAVFQNLTSGKHSLALDVASVPVAMNYLFQGRKIILSERDSQEVLMPLFRAATIKGRVIIEDGGPPPPGPISIAVKAAACALPAEEPFECRSFTEKDGSFTLTGVYPGPTRVSIELPAALQETYAIVKGQVDSNPKPDEIVTDVNLTLRKKVKPAVTTFTACKAPSLDIKVTPELVPRGAEPEVTVSSSQELSEVKAILPTGEAFRLDGRGIKWHGRIVIPDDASPGAMMLKVEAKDTKGSLWTRTLPLVITDSMKLLESSLSPAAVYTGQKVRLSVKSLVAMNRIQISLPWEDVEYSPDDPYFWEAEYAIPEGAASGRYAVTLRVTSSRGGISEDRLTIVVR